LSIEKISTSLAKEDKGWVNHLKFLEFLHFLNPAPQKKISMQPKDEFLGKESRGVPPSLSRAPLPNLFFSFTPFRHEFKRFSLESGR